MTTAGEKCAKWHKKRAKCDNRNTNAEQLRVIRTSGRKSKGYVAPAIRQPDKCKFARPDCCGKPHICQVGGGDCSDYMNKECETRLKNKG